MDENKPKKASTREKRGSRILRERRGGVPKELLEYSRENAKVRKTVATALKEGPRTVPEVAQTTGLPTHEVFWHLMSMRKYGQVIEGAERDSYYEYALKEGEQ